jgi:hypothetical protein
MKNFILFFVITVIAKGVVAQDSTEVRQYDFPFVLSFRYQPIHANAINDLLAANGYNRLPASVWSIGAANSRYWNRFGLGGSLDALSTHGEPGSTRSARIVAFVVGPHVSYYVVQRADFVVYPIIGFRTAFIALQALDKTNATSTNNILSQDHRSATITYFNDLIDFGVGISHRGTRRRRKFDCPQTDRYRLLDFKVGYNVSLSKRSYYGGALLPGGANVQINGFYVRVGYGFGTQITRMNWK